MAQEVTTTGVDMERFEEFRTQMAANRENERVEFRATGTYEGRPLYTRATTGPYMFGDEEIDRIAREFTYHFGSYKDFEEAAGFADPTDRRQTVETALAALSACINASISLGALIHGVDLDDLETTVRIAWDPSVSFWLEDSEDEDGEPRDTFGDLRIDIEVIGEALDEKTLDEIEKWARRSAVYNLVTVAHDCETTVTLKESAAPTW